MLRDENNAIEVGVVRSAKTPADPVRIFEHRLLCLERTPARFARWFTANEEFIGVLRGHQTVISDAGEMDAPGPVHDQIYSLWPLLLHGRALRSQKVGVHIVAKLLGYTGVVFTEIEKGRDGQLFALLESPRSLGPAGPFIRRLG